MKRGELHGVLTAESVELLAATLGPGRNIYVPNSTANADHFAIVIGAEQTSRLVEYFGGGRVYLPGLALPDGKRRGPSLDEVRRLVKLGRSTREIAAQFAVSDRSVAYKRRRIEGEKGKGRKRLQDAHNTP